MSRSAGVLGCYQLLDLLLHSLEMDSDVNGESELELFLLWVKYTFFIESIIMKNIIIIAM